MLHHGSSTKLYSTMTCSLHPHVQASALCCAPGIRQQVIIILMNRGAFPNLHLVYTLRLRWVPATRIVEVFRVSGAYVAPGHHAAVSLGLSASLEIVRWLRRSNPRSAQPIHLVVLSNAWKDATLAVGISLIAGMPGTGFMPPDGHAMMCQRALQQRLQALHCSAQPSMSGRALHPEPVQRRKMLKHKRGCQLQCAAVAEMDPVALDATRRGALLSVAPLISVTPSHQLSARHTVTASL